LARDPHDETMLRAPDRMATLIWSENRIDWTAQFDNRNVMAETEKQLDKQIGTSRNQAAIILSSMVNEMPMTEVRMPLIETLASLCRALDPSRLIATARMIDASGQMKIRWCTR
jgi:hypothetical protein